MRAYVVRRRKGDARATKSLYSPIPTSKPHPQALCEGGVAGAVEGLARRAAPSPSRVPGGDGVGSENESGCLTVRIFDWFVDFRVCLVFCFDVFI